MLAMRAAPLLLALLAAGLLVLFAFFLGPEGGPNSHALLPEEVAASGGPIALELRGEARPSGSATTDESDILEQRVALPLPPDPETPRGEVRVMDEREFMQRLGELGIDARGGVFERLRGQRPELASLVVFVTNADRAPVPGALIAADPATKENLEFHVGSGSFSPNVHRAETDPGGVATLLNLDPGELLLVVGHANYLTQSFGSVEVKQGEATFIEVTLERANSQLAGIVYDQDLAPLADVVVQASRYQEGGAAHQTLSQTAADGSFIVSVQAGSSNLVTFSKLGYSTLSLTGIPAGKTGVVAYLETTATAMIRGHVTQGTGKKPVTAFSIDGQSFSHPSGHFELERNVQAAPLTLRFTAPGFEPKTQVVDLSQEKDVDLGAVPLFGQSDLNGIVLLKTEGEAKPLPGATVTVTSAAAESDTMQTSSDGAFSFGELHGETVTLAVTAQGAAPSTQSVPLSDEGVTYVEVTLEAGQYKVAGTVTDADTKEPIEGAKVELTELAGIATTTSSDGTYELSGIPLESFGLTVSADGYESESSPTFTTPADPSEPLAWDTELQPTGLRLALSVAGAPAPAGIEVFLWDAPAPGLPSAQAAQANLAATRRLALTDAEGHVSFEVPPASYFVQVPNYHLLPTKITKEAESSAWKPLPLPGTTTLSGTIRNADGSPVANTSLWLHSGDQDYSTMMLFHTNSTGAYSIPHLAPRSYALSIIKSATDQSAQHVREVQISGAPSQTLDVTFPPLTATITGRLTDAAGAPIPGAQIGVEYLDAPHRSILAGWVQTASDGTFVVPHLEPGSHRVRSAWTEAPQAFSDVITLAPGQTESVDLVTPPGPGLHITGSIIAGGGGPLGPNFLFITDSQGRQNGNFFSTMDWAYTGTFDIKGLPPGSYSLTVTAMGCKQKTVPVTAGTQNLVIALERE